MELIYINNIFNHHSKDIADVFYRALGNQFIFVETSEPKSNRSLKGANIKTFAKLPYLYSIYQTEYNKISEQELLELTKDAKVVIQGAASDKYIYERLKLNKLTFRISEHFSKGKKWNSLRTIKYFVRNFGLNKKPIFLLNASSQVANDMLKAHSFKNKMFKWGYFPEIIQNDILPIEQVRQILWVGRFIELKHPEIVILAAKILKDKNIDATICVIGDGPLFPSLKQQIYDYGLQDYVFFQGRQDYKEVQLAMSKSDLFLFSSDIGEGWGAVLNESMGNACIPIANIGAGSTGFLVRDEINGFIYDGSLLSFEEVFLKVLLMPSKELNYIKKNAYQTIHNLWSAEVAGTRLLDFIEKYENENMLQEYSEGPMSKAVPEIYSKK